MIRFTLLLSLLLTVPAMARDGYRPLPNPRTDVVTPDGSVRAESDEPTDAEIAQSMWRQYMGDAPMPPHLRRKYGIPDPAPIPGR